MPPTLWDANIGAPTLKAVILGGGAGPLLWICSRHCFRPGTRRSCWATDVEGNDTYSDTLRLLEQATRAENGIINHAIKVGECCWGFFFFLDGCAAAADGVPLIPRSGLSPCRGRQSRRWGPGTVGLSSSPGGNTGTWESQQDAQVFVTRECKFTPAGKATHSSCVRICAF